MAWGAHRVAPLWAGSRSLPWRGAALVPKGAALSQGDRGAGESLHPVEKDVGCGPPPACREDRGRPHQGLLCCPHAHTDYLGEGLSPSCCWMPAPLCTPTPAPPSGTGGTAEPCGPSTTPGQQSREFPCEMRDTARHSGHGKAPAPSPVTFGQQVWRAQREC